MTTEQIEAFLADYKTLVARHGMWVGACGCCNSPWLVNQFGDRVPDAEAVVRFLRESTEDNNLLQQSV